MKLVYFLDNKLGGVTSLVSNLIEFAPSGDVEQYVIHIDCIESVMTRSNANFPNAKCVDFKYSAQENLYEVMRNLFQLLPSDPCALVLNYELEMQMLDHYEVPHTTFQLVHDEYNLNLALKYHHVVDVFIAHNRHIYSRLIDALPDRSSQIFYLPHGVRIPEISTFKTPDLNGKPIKLFFLGRMTAGKGIYDLPEISKCLKEKGIPFVWTCVGDGPEKEALVLRWKEDQVCFLAPDSNEEVMSIAAAQHVFVLPTQFEGSPVSLLEAMSVGLVPVITDLEGGIREAVSPEVGYRIKNGDVRAFADAIAELYASPDVLASKSRQAIATIKEKFWIEKTVKTYFDTFGDFVSFYKRKSIKKRKVGARLDQAWMPSGLTKAIRGLKSLI